MQLKGEIDMSEKKTNYFQSVKMRFFLKQIHQMINSSEVYHNPNLLQDQIKTIDKQIHELEQQKYNMQLYIDALKKYNSYDQEATFTIEYMTEEKIELSPSLKEYGQSLNSMSNFLIYCRKKGLPFDCPIGRMFTQFHLDRKQWHTPEYVYFKKLDGQYKKEAGKYLVYTSYSDGTNINTIYNTIFNYIKEHQLQVSGNI